MIKIPKYGSQTIKETPKYNMDQYRSFTDLKFVGIKMSLQAFYYNKKNGDLTCSLLKSLNNHLALHPTKNRFNYRLASSINQKFHNS